MLARISLAAIVAGTFQTGLISIVVIISSKTGVRVASAPTTTRISRATEPFSTRSRWKRRVDHDIAAPEVARQPAPSFQVDLDLGQPLFGRDIERSQRFLAPRPRPARFRGGSGNGAPPPRPCRRRCPAARRRRPSEGPQIAARDQPLAQRQHSRADVSGPDRRTDRHGRPAAPGHHFGEVPEGFPQARVFRPGWPQRVQGAGHSFFDRRRIAAVSGRSTGMNHSDSIIAGSMIPAERCVARRRKASLTRRSRSASRRAESRPAAPRRRLPGPSGGLEMVGLSVQSVQPDHGKDPDHVVDDGKRPSFPGPGRFVQPPLVEAAQGLRSDQAIPVADQALAARRGGQALPDDDGDLASGGDG